MVYRNLGYCNVTTKYPQVKKILPEHRKLKNILPNIIHNLILNKW